MDFTVATIGSHSSLEILKGAKDEGFKTALFVLESNRGFYSQYPFIDRIVSLADYAGLKKIEKEFAHVPMVMVPHGSFVAYLGASFDKTTLFRYFGSKRILEIEGNRRSQHDWLERSGISIPRVFSDVNKVDCPVIVKSFGAMGGQGYVLCPDRASLKKALIDPKGRYIIQEYITGTPVYVQFFRSVIRNRVEIMGCDRRYESSVDAIGRIPSKYQGRMVENPSFTVIGNFPLVLRESLLPKVMAMAEKVVAASQRLAPGGLFGPFCLETVIDGDQRIFVIEISCRIVAGTNLFISGSPYSDLLFGKPVSMGRRIAMEIAEAIRDNRLEEITT